MDCGGFELCEEIIMMDYVEVIDEMKEVEFFCYNGKIRYLLKIKIGRILQIVC